MKERRMLTTMMIYAVPGRDLVEDRVALAYADKPRRKKRVNKNMRSLPGNRKY